MNRNKTLIFFIIIFFLSLVSAAPPSTPLIIYGKVMYENNLPIGGVSVKASWTGNDGNVYTKVVKTLDVNNSEVIKNPVSLGLYTIEINDPVPDSEITISSVRQTISVKATNAVSIKAQDIKIRVPVSGEEKTNSTKNSILKNIADFIAKILGINKDSKNPEGEFNSSSEDRKNTEGTSSKEFDSASNQKNVINNKNSGNNSRTSNSNSTEDNESLESSSDSINGKDLDIEKNAVGEDYSRSINISEDTKSWTHTIQSSVAYQYLKKKIYSLQFLDYLILFLVLFAIIIYFIIRKIRSTEAFTMPINYSLKNISRIESKRFANKEQLYLNPVNSILDAIDIFVKYNTNIIPIVPYKTISGIITKRDILALNNFDFDYLNKTKLEKIMKKKFISSKQNEPLGDIYNKMLQSKTNELVIEKDSELVGTIDYFNFIEIFNKTNFVIENPPTLGEAMDKSVSKVNYNTSLQDLREKFLKENIDYSIVYKNQKPIGIITTKDLISAIKSEVDFKSHTVERIMSNNIVSMTEGTDIYKAFNIMLERRFNQIPIKQNDEIIGIIHVKYLVKLYYEFIIELQKRKKDIIPLD